MLMTDYLLPNKVQLFWEGHTNLRNLPYGFDIYLVNVKTMRKIEQIFVAFSEKLNFKCLHSFPTKLFELGFKGVISLQSNRRNQIYL